ncbi:MAG: hypothetical protein ABIJ40_02990 [Bacteroidota bacterium]
MNYTTKGIRRVDLVFGIGYGDDILKAKSVLMRIVQQDSRILKDPAPAVIVCSLGESSIDFNVRPWINIADYWDVYFAITENVKLEFDKEGISIPFPQRDVHIYEHKK